MNLVITELLDMAELEAMRAHLESALKFKSGKTTAGHHARAVKDNEQASAESAAPILAKVEATLLNHPVFKAAARPKKFVKLMISRYGPGMHYGTHVDDPLMGGIRTDLSFTLFLKSPESYEGGSLIVEDNEGDRAYKLAAGSLILYSTTSLHRVEEVRSGERLAIVGWIRSYLRDPQQREMLFDLENTIATLNASQAPRPVLDQLYKMRANLLRMWVED